MKAKRSFIALIGAYLCIAAHSVSAANTKVGYSYDMGLGITAQIDDKFNFMIGNDGLAGDYLFNHGNYREDLPLTWYLGGGVFVKWDKGYGVRLPLGIDSNFSPNWNAYAQVSPDIDFYEDIALGIDAAIGLRYSF